MHTCDRSHSQTCTQLGMLLLDTFPTYTVKRIIIIIAFVGFVCERLEQLQLQIICQPQGQLFFFLATGEEAKSFG